MISLQLKKRKKLLGIITLCLIATGSLIDTNMISFADAGPGVSQADSMCTQLGTQVFKISNDSGNSVVQSGSFRATDGQKLTIEVTTNISGGTVDLFLFSPSGKEERLTFNSSNVTKTIELSEGTWAYNATGFFESGNIRITGATAGPGVSQKPLQETKPDSICSQDGTRVFKISNDGSKAVVQSGSFQSVDGQKLTIEAAGDIKGGTVDLFLFSPSGKEERLTFSSSDSKTIELSEGTWAYNATGFFESGNIMITGTTESSK